MRVDEVDLPVPGAKELRISVEAAGVNYYDTYVRSGLYKAELPLTLGQEAAGVVTAVGEGVTEFRVGDTVATARASGAYAEEVIVEAAHCVRIPEDVTQPDCGGRDAPGHDGALSRV